MPEAGYNWDMKKFLLSRLSANFETMSLSEFPLDFLNPKILGKLFVSIKLSWLEKGFHGMFI